jgi:hypothetical protein
MPGAGGNDPNFKGGEPLSARKLNESMRSPRSLAPGQFQSSLYSVQKRVVGGAGEGAVVAIGTTDEEIDARDPGVGPGLSANISIIKENGGAATSLWENWSSIPIPIDSVVLAIEIDGDMVIISAFC